jgi:ribosomal protein L25 (general stress protein Ctc)
MEKPISVVCERNEFVKLYRKAGHSTPITLNGDGIDEMVLIHDYQLDPVMDTVIHIDFL